MDMNTPCSHDRVRKLSKLVHATDPKYGWYICDACGTRLLLRLEIVLSADAAYALYALTSTPPPIPEPPAHPRPQAMPTSPWQPLNKWRYCPSCGNRRLSEMCPSTPCPDATPFIRCPRMAVVASIPAAKQTKVVKNALDVLLNTSVDELELSVRAANCLQNIQVSHIRGLVRLTESEMLKTKNFGRKSLKEVKAVLAEIGLTLGMKFDA